MAFTKQEYQNYLHSHEWRELRDARATMVGGYRCEQCGSSFKVEGHHIEYKNLFDCTVEDIRLLCQSCHCAIHKPEQKANAKQWAKERRALEKRWKESVRSMVRPFSKHPSKASLRTMIDALEDFYTNMK